MTGQEEKWKERPSVRTWPLAGRAQLLQNCGFFCVYAYKVFGENPSNPLISFLADISMGFSISMFFLNYHINLAAVGTCDLG